MQNTSNFAILFELEREKRKEVGMGWGRFNLSCQRGKLEIKSSKITIWVLLHFTLPYPTDVHVSAYQPSYSRAINFLRSLRALTCPCTFSIRKLKIENLFKFAILLIAAMLIFVWPCCVTVSACTESRYSRTWNGRVRVAHIYPVTVERMIIWVPTPNQAHFKFPRSTRVTFQHALCENMNDK